jgi:hypothetical protein
VHSIRTRTQVLVPLAMALPRIAEAVLFGLVVFPITLCVGYFAFQLFYALVDSQLRSPAARGAWVVRS